MKIFFFLTLFSITAFFHLVRADEEDTRILKMQPQEVAANLKSAQGYRIRGSLIRAAIEAGRLDLIEICFRTEPLLTVEALGKTHNLPFQDQAALIILRADIPGSWMPEDPMADYSGPGPDGYLYEPIPQVVRRYLPDLDLKGDTVINRASRLKLASELELKMAGQIPKQIPEGTKSVPGNREKNALPKTPNKVRVADSPLSTPDVKPVWALALIAVAIIVAALATIRWLLGRRHSP